MQETISVSQERKKGITKKASELSGQIEAKCMPNLIDQVKAYATSAQIVIPIKEVQVTLDIATITGPGTRVGTSNEVTIPISPTFSNLGITEEKSVQWTDKGEEEQDSERLAMTTEKEEKENVYINPL